ncbi:MAG: CHAT domain-containing protein, partial [Candidatus Celaenobacter polaris]|nr:CHAT domain-containing protein [Candidatus Celaenobacter polaris]
NIGSVYQSWEQYDKAIEYYRKALAITEELGMKEGIARVLNNIGSVYQSWEQYDKAIEYYRKALAIDEELSRKEGIAIRLNNIGLVYESWGQYDKAIEYYRKALTINEELGGKGDIALNLNNIGSSYFELKKYKEAEYNFNKSIEIKEKLRLTAEGAVRRDYLASQIETYQLLISTYIRSNKPALAFSTTELSSAKYLIEQMVERLKEKDILFEGIKNYQKKLNNNTAIINYSNINLVESARIVVDKNNIFAIEVSKKDLTSNINIKYKNVISNAVENLRGIKIKEKEKDEILTKIEEDYDFEKIINYYRLLLSKSNPGSKEEETIQYIGKELYKFLFGSIEKQLKGKDELIIIPDGVLSFLPFETLIMPDGRYLIEKYHIKYTQSLTVSEIIAKRKYNENRKPLLAFGGAVYDELSYETDIVKSEKHLEYLTNETLLSLNRGQDVRKAYASLELSEWKNLPGTLAEVKALQYLIKDSDIYTGKSVDESRVKSLSKKGGLREYKVLHFATHGLVVPEIPELSAIVLSLSKNEYNNEDGYLTMKEILGLDINADFVNLSACETGLGKIYGGEGVVGLTQSFLIAGANGLSVSLWQVADESTMKFMIGVYKLVQDKGMSYDRAITEMKRAFISGAVSTEKYDKKRGLILNDNDLINKKPNNYSSPFYWAPFVYYGK